ncbi:hypothetical protein B9Z19DRAFT_786661 [Tuber borchii]|uniref:Uncharacterized protein n=1 Tax=Tuber borchii TaxID=42251 RepID=A0A2T7A7L3_TUBBO|nr:hypothetical protein B9Z19DRAFT_786661 [Tuber borchii]
MSGHAPRSHFLLPPSSSASPSHLSCPEQHPRYQRFDHPRPYALLTVIGISHFLLQQLCSLLVSAGLIFYPNIQKKGFESHRFFPLPRSHNEITIS